MKDVGLLIARLIAGSLVAGHGAQKLFGWFEGPGWQTWTRLTESMMGMRPGRVWGTLQAAGEFGGGALTALGFLNPLADYTASGQGPCHGVAPGAEPVSQQHLAGQAIVHGEQLRRTLP
jgi:uncharacterized membrane protein YphA (DoxX/SURF4 family)